MCCKGVLKKKTVVAKETEEEERVEFREIRLISTLNTASQHHSLSRKGSKKMTDKVKSRHTQNRNYVNFFQQ